MKKYIAIFYSQHIIAIFNFPQTHDSKTLLKRNARTQENDDQLKTLIIILILIKLNKVFHLIIERKLEEKKKIRRRSNLSFLSVFYCNLKKYENEK